MQERLLPQGIKVLSLFFIDRVANYVDDNGLIKRLFDEAFQKIKERYSYFHNLRPEDVREAYFAKSKDQIAIDTDGRTTLEREAERSAFELIMRQKEQLLSLSEPVCFIFAHSALREGWDNPNVFQICTLNQTVSEVKKRQEIGRGLRLCVNQEGERLFGDEVNILTVVANESYQSYAANLQQEYVESGDAAPPAPSDARKRYATRNDRIFRESTEFKGFWERLTRKIQYRVAVDTPALIERCASRLNRESFPAPMVVVEKGDFVVTRYTFKVESVNQKKALISIEILNTKGETTTISRYFQERDDLSRILREDRLRGFKILTIIDAGDQSRVCFENARELDLYTPFTFESEAGQRPRERVSLVPETTYPVFNLLDRAAHETGLTRSTVNMIFKQLSDAKKQVLLKNPEGFAGIFINTINNTLADHIAERVEFKVEDGIKTVNLEELFPPKRPFPQRELIEAGETGLYDQVQVDSQVEELFVKHRLKPDTKVLFYFKFPPAFKVHFPRVIGNYNPDWGIVRYDETGRVILHLIRETKGTQDESKLQFPQERRKIDCARKYFKTLQIDYRHITDHTQAWWLPDDAQQQLLEMRTST